MVIITRKTILFVDLFVILMGLIWMAYRFMVGMDNAELIYSLVYVSFVVLSLLLNLSVIYQIEKNG